MPIARRSISLKVAVAAALVASAAGASAQTVLTVSSWVSPSHPLSRAQVEWCGQVTKATENRVTCNVLPKAVVPPPQTFDAIRDGLADVSFTVDGYLPGRFVATKVAEMPFSGDSATATSVAYQRIYDKYIAKLGEHKGVKVLSVFTHGPGNIFNNKRPVRTLADLDGIKFRVGGGVVNDIGKALGVNMTLKPAPQSYELLSSGVVDGVWFPNESVESFNLGKLIKYRTSIPGGLYNTSFVFMMNPDTFARLDPKDQAAIEKLGGETAARMFGRYWDAEDTRSKAFQQAQGIEVTNADEAFIADFKKRTASVEQDWIKAAEAMGLKNAAQVLAEFRAEAKKLQ